MIEIETSKTGLPILKSEGRFLNSSYDPMAEAQVWLQSVSDKVKDFEFICLLGIGSSYHCMTIQKKYPNKHILVIENDKQLIEKTAELFFDLKKIKICKISDSRDLMSHSDVMNFSQELFCTLRLPSTRFSNKELFDDVETVLTGRASYEFAKFCDARPQLREQLDLEKMGANKLISIKDVAEAFKASGQKLTHERRVVYVLEELIR